MKITELIFSILHCARFFEKLNYSFQSKTFNLLNLYLF